MSVKIALVPFGKLEVAKHGQQYMMPPKHIQELWDAAAAGNISPERAVESIRAWLEPILRQHKDAVVYLDGDPLGCFHLSMICWANGAKAIYAVTGKEFAPPKGIACYAALEEDTPFGIPLPKGTVDAGSIELQSPNGSLVCIPLEHSKAGDLVVIKGNWYAWNHVEDDMTSLEDICYALGVKFSELHPALKKELIRSVISACAENVPDSRDEYEDIILEQIKELKLSSFASPSAIARALAEHTMGDRPPDEMPEACSEAVDLATVCPDCWKEAVQLLRAVWQHSSKQPAVVPQFLVIDARGAVIHLHDMSISGTDLVATTSYCGRNEYYADELTGLRHVEHMVVLTGSSGNKQFEWARNAQRWLDEQLKKVRNEEVGAYTASETEFNTLLRGLPSDGTLLKTLAEDEKAAISWLRDLRSAATLSELSKIRVSLPQYKRQNR